MILIHSIQFNSTVYQPLINGLSTFINGLSTGKQRVINVVRVNKTLINVDNPLIRVNKGLIGG